MTQETMEFYPRLKLPTDLDAITVWNTLHHNPGIKQSGLLSCLNHNAPLGDGPWDAKRIRDAIGKCHGLVVSRPGGGGYSRVTDVTFDHTLKAYRIKRRQALTMMVNARAMLRQAKLLALPGQSKPTERKDDV